MVSDAKKKHRSAFDFFLYLFSDRFDFSVKLILCDFRKCLQHAVFPIFPYILLANRMQLIAFVPIAAETKVFFKNGYGTQAKDFRTVFQIHDKVKRNLCILHDL